MQGPTLTRLRAIQNCTLLPVMPDLIGHLLWDNPVAMRSSVKLSTEEFK
jgi:hypothetical protein